MSDDVHFDELLIMSVEKHPNLYNKRLKDFKDNVMKENSWLAIAEQLNSDVEMVKKRWENLRDRFVRAHTQSLKQAPSGSGADVNTTKINFPFFQIMLWLVPHIRKRKLVSATSRVVTIQTEDRAVDSDESQALSEGASSVGIEEGWYDVNDSGLLSPSGSEPQSHTPKTKKEKSIPDTLSKAVESFTSFVNAKIQSSCENTYNDSSDMNFMKSVVSDMAQFPPSKKIKFKREVMELLEKYILETEAEQM